MVQAENGTQNLSDDVLIPSQVLFGPLPKPKEPETPYVIEPTSPHTHTIIFLPYSSVSPPEFAKSLRICRAAGKGASLLEHFPHVKWVIPYYSERTPESWTEIKWSEYWERRAGASIEDKAGPVPADSLQDSTYHIQDVIYNEMLSAGGQDKCILAGIGQGCATAVRTLITYDLCLGGLVALGGWLPPLPERVLKFGKEWFQTKMHFASVNTTKNGDSGRSRDVKIEQVDIRDGASLWDIPMTPHSLGTAPEPNTLPMRRPPMSASTNGGVSSEEVSARDGDVLLKNLVNAKADAEAQCYDGKTHGMFDWIGGLVKFLEHVMGSKGEETER
jgi:pimeloyl-ACP methyl ester carboxylesterase